MTIKIYGLNKLKIEFISVKSMFLLINDQNINKVKEFI